MTERTEAVMLRVENDLAELERVGRELEELGLGFGLSAGDISAIGLAVDEILTNVITYAFPTGEEHVVEIRVRREDGVLTVEIEDDGRPFDPAAAPEPRLDGALEDRPVGGLGIHIARRLVDEMSYSRRWGRNRLTLKKRLAKGEGVVAGPRPEGVVPISESMEQGAVVFGIAGRLGVRGAALLEKKLRARLAEGAARFVFDCARLEFLSSAGLRVLLIAAKEAAADGGGVALTAPPQAIARTIEIAGLSRLLPSYAARSDALRALSGRR